MATKRISLSTPTMHGDEMPYIKEAFDKNWIAPLGFNCDSFEKEMGEYLSDGKDLSLNTLALCSGTSALHLACKLAGVKRGDVVLCSDMTFAATVNPVSYEGGVQVFVDSERETWNMDPEALEAAFKKYPDAKVVDLVHLYGIPAKIDEIRDICKKHNAILIEDAAEALSATYKGRKCGTFGDFSAISFNGNKIITTSGGGMLITHTKESRDKAFYFSTQARMPEIWYQHEDIGYNYRMSNVVAGIGRGQLKHIDEHRDLKTKIYKKYEEGLKGLPVKMNPYLKDTTPNFWLSCLIIDEGVAVKPIEIYHSLIEKNIETRPIWKPMHMQPVFGANDFISVSEKPVDEDVFARGLCLPSDIKMTDEEQEEVKKLFTNLGFSALNFTDSRSTFQFYNLARLWDDIQTALNNNLTLLHPATEPIQAGDLYRFLTGKEYKNELPGKSAEYDYRTCHAKLYGKEGPYLCTKDEVMQEIREFVNGSMQTGETKK